MWMEEQKLTDRLKKRSRSALEQAIRRYTPYVSATVWNTLSASSATREDVEEVTADVFLALWDHAGDLDSGRLLLPWLGTVARNKATDRLRRLPAAAAPLTELDPSPSPGPEEAAEQREWYERLWQAVEDMEEPDHTLFLRHYYYGDKLKDVARALGMNLSTAKSRLLRGRRALRERLTKGGNGSAP